ncbi:MAG: PAS domain S-box protein, partial [Nitrospirota bacterium]
MSSADHLSELESLRLQVAELSRALAERDRHLDRSRQDQPEQSDLLRAIVEGTAADTGEEFFRSLVRHLAQALKVRYAFVGEWHEQASAKLHTLAVWSGTDFAEPFEFALPNTPCDNVIGQHFCLHESGVQRLFPEDPLLVQLEVDSYCGMPLVGKSGKPLGILVIMDDRPITRAPLAKDLMQIFGMRAAAELQRQQADEILRESERRLRLTQFAVDHAEDGVLWADESKQFIYANEAACRLLGYSNEELLTLSISDIAPYHDPSRFQQRLDLLKQGTAATYESIHRRKDGTEFPIEASVTYLKHEGRGYTCGIVRDISERKRVEKALRESEQRFALAVEGSTDILWDAHRLLGEPWYAPQTPIWWSPRVRELLGLEESESFETLEQWAVRLHPDDKDRVFGQLAAHIEHRVPPYDAEYRLRTNRGDYRWIRGRGQAMWDKQGEVRRMSGSCQDITDQKWVEEKLRLSEERQELALSGANLGLWDWDVSSGNAVLDARWCSMIGYALDELEPHVNTWLSLLHPEDAPTIQAILESHLKNETPDYHVEFRLRHKAGHWTWILARGRVVERDHAGAPLRMTGTHMDITDRKRAEDAIREAELRYRTIFEQAGAGVAQIESRTGRFIQVNRQYCEIVGLTEAEMLATTFGAITHPDDLERNFENRTRLLSGEVPSFTMEKRYVRKDGSIVWVNLNVAPLWRPGEMPVYHIAIVLDITERKRAEEALRRSERQLRTVLDALPVGVWFTDQSGKSVLSNPAAKQIWSGIKQVGIETAANGAGWWEAIGPSSELHRWALSQSLTKGVSSLNETLDLECLDGTRKTIRNTTVPVQDEAGIVLGAIVLNEDITALRQAQEALKLTQFSVDHAVEGFFWISPDARILNVNNAACRMLEYTRDELTTMTMHDIDPNLPSDLWSVHWKGLKQKGSMTFESKLWSKTGRVLDTEVTINYLDYEGSEYNCVIMRDIGERKRVEASLRQSEERYRSLVDNAPIGIFVNEGGRFAYVNREMQRILKATSVEQLIGTPVLERIAPEFHTVVKDRIHELLNSGQPAPPLDEQYVRLDGSRVDVAVTAIPTSFDGTSVIQVLVLDIAERKQAEEALRKNHSLLSAIMDTATDFIYVKDLAGCYLLINSALARFMGKSVEEVFGQDDHALLPPELAASCVTSDQQVIATGTAVTQEEYGTVGGKTIVYLTTKAPYRDREGRIIGVIGVSRDISERKQAEEQLRNSHSFIRQIIDTDPNFIFAKDREGRFTLVNQALAGAYGSTVEDLVGKTDADFNGNPDEVEFFRKKDLEVMDSLQERFIPEETVTDSTGRTRWLQTVKRPILDGQGRAIMVLGAATDITERKHMEEALRQRERDLRAAVDERERISQDLHDGILQSLFAVGLTLETSKSMMSPGSRKTAGPPLDQAIDQLNRVMHEIRNFIAGIGSDLLHGKDLPTA